MIEAMTGGLGGAGKDTAGQGSKRPVVGYGRSVLNGDDLTADAG